MKAVFIFVACFISYLATAGLPPTAMKGQLESAKQTTFFFETPGNQATTTAPSTRLIETGNSNQLANPSFEHQTAGTSWTASGSCSTIDPETTNVISGLKAVSVTPGAGTCSIFQDVAPANIAQITNKNGLLSIWVKTANSVVVCLRNDGTRDDSQCSSAVSSSTLEWIKVELPVVFTGSTSFGIEVYKAGSGTGAIILDHAKEGLLPDGYIQQVAQAQLGGSSYFAGTAGCASWTRTSTTVGSVATDTDCPGPTVTSSYVGTWATTDSDLPRQTVTNLPPGRYIVHASFPLFGSGSNNAKATITDGVTSCTPQFVEMFATNTVQANVSCEFNYTSGGTTANWEIQIGSSVNTLTVDGSVLSPVGGSVSYRVEYYPPPSQIISGGKCDDLINCETTFGARIANNGTATKTSESNTGIIASVTRSGLGRVDVVFKTGAFSVIPKIDISIERTIDQNFGYGIESLTTSGLTVVTSRATSFVDMNFHIGITRQGTDYQNSKVNRIIATLDGFVKAPGTVRPKTCYAQYGGAGSLASQTNCTSSPCTEYVDTCTTLSATRTSTGIFNIIGAAGTCKASSRISCDLTNASNGVNGIRVEDGSTDAVTDGSGGFSLTKSTYISGGALTDTRHSWRCDCEFP